MTFAETFKAMGQIVDDILEWHLSLPWYYLVPLIIVYMIAIWALNKMMYKRYTN